MEIVTIDDFRLSYVIKNPEAQHTVFFIHGNSGSVKSWDRQWEDHLFDDYRLIAIDLPGHGQSSDSSNPSEDYAPLNTAAIMAKAIKRLATNTFALIGFSYGTNIIAEMLAHGVNPKAIVLISPCVAGKEAMLNDVLIEPEKSIYFFDDIPGDKALEFLNQRMKSDKATIEQYWSDYVNTRVPFRSSLIAAAMQGKYSDEVELLREAGIPLCVVFGREDNLVSTSILDKIALPYWKNSVYKLREAGHYVHTDLAQEVNTLIAAYLEEQIK